MTEVNYKTIQLAYDSGVATITLNRPDKRNAISFELIDDLLRALKEVETSDAHRAHPDRRGQSFLFRHGPGQSESADRPLAGAEPERFGDDGPPVPFALRISQGHDCRGERSGHRGGTGLALLCDFTLAVPEAKFGYTEVRIGFVPAIVSTFLLRQVGEKQARDLLLTGRIIGADEAARMGLVNEIVAPENLMTRARELAALLMENSPTSLRATKKLLSDHARAELDLQIEAAVRENAAIRTTADFREGVVSFLEKRKPGWSGKKSGK